LHQRGIAKSAESGRFQPPVNTRYVQNEPACTSGMPLLVSGIDEFWLEDESRGAPRPSFMRGSAAELVAKGLVADDHIICLAGA
jgi:hypothetical protein